MKYFLLALFLSACAAQPHQLCSVPQGAEWMLIPVSWPLCVLTYPMPGDPPSGLSYARDSWTVLGPGTDVSFIYRN